MIPAWRCVQCAGSTLNPSSATILTADISSRSCAAEGTVGHRRQPDVGVEADLVRGVAGQHRAAARLRNVADENAGPDALLRRLSSRSARERRSSPDCPNCDCATGASPARSRRRPAAPWPRRGSRASRSRSSGPAIRSASARGRTTSLAASLGSPGLASGGSGCGSSVPTSCAKTLVSSARPARALSSVRRRSGGMRCPFQRRVAMIKRRGKGSNTRPSGSGG